MIIRLFCIGVLLNLFGAMSPLMSAEPISLKLSFDVRTQELLLVLRNETQVPQQFYPDLGIRMDAIPGVILYRINKDGSLDKPVTPIQRESKLHFGPPTMSTISPGSEIVARCLVNQYLKDAATVAPKVYTDGCVVCIVASVFTDDSLKTRISVTSDPLVIRSGRLEWVDPAR